MNTTNALIETEYRLGAHNYKPIDVVLSRGEGVYVWDLDGNRYLDCLSAYSAVNQGHCHPKILAAMVEQAGKLTLTSRAFRSDQLAHFYEELAALTGSHKILPMNSGAEAVETAVKAVRKWGYEVKGVAENKAEIIVCSNNFHGRTMGIVGFSTDPDARSGFGPFAPGFKTVPFGDIEAFRSAINENTVAFLIEPIQGEAGVMIPPQGYFPEVRALCSKHGITLILDEIQTGLGRTGKLLAEEHEGIEADVTLIGKALSGGFYPVSAVLSNSEVLGVLKPGQHGSTFGGNPAGLRHCPRLAESTDRRRHDRQFRPHGGSFPGGPQGYPLQHHQGGARPWPDARRRAGSRSRRRPQILRSAERTRHPCQGHPWRHDPHRSAAGHHGGSGGLGCRTIRRYSHRTMIGGAKPQNAAFCTL